MKIIIDNLAAEYKDEGMGEVLLFLHGWKDSLHSFDSLTNELVKNYRIVRLDLPGFGKTEAPKTAWKLDDYINFTRKFIAKLGVAPRVLIGHSFGGRIIIKGVAEGVLSAEKLILIGSAGIAKRKTLRNLVFLIIAKLGKIIFFIPPLHLLYLKFRGILYKRTGGDYETAGVLRPTFVNVIRENLSVYAGKINTPTLLIWGKNDTATPYKDGLRLKEMIQGSKFVAIENSGHLVHQEKPEEISKLIHAFI